MKPVPSAAFLLPLLLAAPSLAQATLPARAFLPDEHRNVICADLAAMRACGVWDELETSALKLVFAAMERELGFALGALDRVTSVFEVREGGMVGQGARVTVFEGNRPLDVPASVAELWTLERTGEIEVRRRGEDVFVRPRPEIHVEGSEQLVQPVLDGKPHGGMPCPDVLSLLSGRGDQLAWMVVDLASPQLAERVLDPLFPGVEWPERDEPRFLCLRLVATGDADDPRLGIEAVLRHPTPGDGLKTSVEAATALLERWRAMPQLRAVRPLLQRVRQHTDAGDLVLSLDLGRARDGVGQLAMLGLPLFSTVQSEPVLVVEAESEPPPAEPKKKQ